MNATASPSSGVAATTSAMSEWTTYPALMVADGSLDLAVHFGMHWDHAALAGVVVAAGGTVAYDEPSSDERRFAAVFTNGCVTA